MAHLTYFLRPFQLCLEKFVTSVWLSRSAYLGFCIECIVSIKYSKFLLPRLLTRESRKTTLIQKLFWYFQCECAGECFFFCFFLAEQQVYIGFFQPLHEYLSFSMFPNCILLAFLLGSIFFFKNIMLLLLLEMDFLNPFLYVSFLSLAQQYIGILEVLNFWIA